MAKVNSLECTGDTLFSGNINRMEGILYAEGKRMYTYDVIFPVGSVYLNINSSKPSILYNSGTTWESAGSFTIGSTTVYAWKRTA